jgi:hypothetical protein
MLFREIIAVYFENHMKAINTVWRQNCIIFNIKASDRYSDQCVERIKRQALRKEKK